MEGVWQVERMRDNVARRMKKASSSIEEVYGRAERSGVSMVCACEWCVKRSGKVWESEDAGQHTPGGAHVVATSRPAQQQSFRSRDTHLFKTTAEVPPLQRAVDVLQERVEPLTQLGLGEDVVSRHSRL